jgi:F0F1-type ATP synthase membrane subunit c/vacuolar-type H+-ATPase subunit K
LRRGAARARVCLFLPLLFFISIVNATGLYALVVINFGRVFNFFYIFFVLFSTRRGAARRGAARRGAPARRGAARRGAARRGAARRRAARRRRGAAAGAARAAPRAARRRAAAPARGAPRAARPRAARRGAALYCVSVSPSAFLLFSIVNATGLYALFFIFFHFC